MSDTDGTPPHESTVVYRCYRADGALLYVGCTGDWKRRQWEHNTRASWWPDVVHTTTEAFLSRERGLAAEAEAIRVEAPIHNVLAGGVPPELRAHAERVSTVGRELAEAHRAVGQAEATLDAAIAEARDAGAGLDRLAKWAGTTKAWMQRRVNRLEKAPPRS